MNPTATRRHSRGRRGFPRHVTAAALLVLLIAAASSAVALEIYTESPKAPGLKLASQIVAYRIDGGVVVDGKLDERVWSNPTAAPLIQRDPDCGAPPTQRTDWWVAYDDEAIYVAARCHDTAPDSILANLARRDNWVPSDRVYVNLDTFNDDRNAYSFNVSAAGAIGDARLYNDGWDDSTWDGVWESATHIDDGGWNVEIKIPFSQLSFPKAQEQVWGINFSRRMGRSNERSDVFYMPREESGYTGRFPDLVGIQGVCPGNNVEVMPYAVTKVERLEIDGDNPFTDGSEQDIDGGLDLKWCPSSTLTLNATFNPDFGQVEVDPAVVNLSDAETYFDERRPFFVQDYNIYRFGREGTSSSWGLNWSEPTPFYSRRIGRNPQLWPSADWSDRPDGTTILGAGKLSGRFGPWQVGLLNATTAEEKATLDIGGVRSEETVEPLTNYTVARMKRDFDGKAGLGFMATGVQRDLSSDLARDRLTSSAYSLGVDGWTFLDDDEGWAMKGYFSGSSIKGSAAAIDRVQNSYRHYMARMDAGHIDYDPNRTGLSGYAGRVMVNKQKGNIRLNTAFGAVSPGYEISDLGWMYRADKLNFHAAPGYRWLEPKGIMRSAWIDVAGYSSWDFDGTPDQRGFYSSWGMTMMNYMGVWGTYSYTPDYTSVAALRGGPNVRLPESRSGTLHFDTNGRKPLYLHTWGSFWDTHGNGHGAGGGLEVVYKPSSALRISTGPEYTWNQEQLQWVGSVGDPLMEATGGRRYIFSEMDYREFALTTRVDWTFSPKLSLQTYMQPLFVSGDYDQFKEFQRPSSSDWSYLGRDNGSTVAYDAGSDEYEVDPDGDGPAEAFTISNPDFSYRSLKVNMILRWEYDPGSTLYFVWTQDRVNFDDPGDFSLGAGTRALLDAPGDDIFMVKATRWLNF